MGRWLATLSAGLALALALLFALPLIALGDALSASSLARGLRDPALLPALRLSAATGAATLSLTVLAGTPLAWWLARGTGRSRGLVSAVVALPIVLPPAVVGVALLSAFAGDGLVGGPLAALGVDLSFSVFAVVIAQLVVAAPFYVHTAAAAFRGLDARVLTVARTLGATPAEAFARVALPACAPALWTGAGLAAARALGEFGATLLFAGNMPGRTQTLPLAIYAALESDVSVAVVFSTCLAALAIGGGVLAAAVSRRAADTRRRAS